MLELCNVCKRFSGIVAVDDVSFTARAGGNHRIPRAERLGQIDHDEDDYRAAAAYVRAGSVSMVSRSTRT